MVSHQRGKKTQIVKGRKKYNMEVTLQKKWGIACNAIKGLLWKKFIQRSMRVPNFHLLLQKIKVCDNIGIIHF